MDQAADESYSSPNTMALEKAPENSIGQITSGPTKEKIPAASIIQMLNVQPLREELMPLLKAVLDEISNIEGLDDAISNLLKDKQNVALTTALKKLQDKLQSIYEGKVPRAQSEGGKKRRRTNKRKNYKKRRSTKHR